MSLAFSENDASWRERTRTRSLAPIARDYGVRQYWAKCLTAVVVYVESYRL